MEHDHPSIKKLKSMLARNKPVFEDYLNSALDISSLNKKQKTIWRRFFSALSITRNKVSHSDHTLSSSEITALKNGGFGALISLKGEIEVNPRIYFQMSAFILDFFDLIYAQ